MLARNKSQLLRSLLASHGAALAKSIEKEPQPTAWLFELIEQDNAALHTFIQAFCKLKKQFIEFDAKFDLYRFYFAKIFHNTKSNKLLNTYVSFKLLIQKANFLFLNCEKKLDVFFEEYCISCGEELLPLNERMQFSELIDAGCWLSEDEKIQSLQQLAQEFFSMVQTTSSTTFAKFIVHQKMDSQFKNNLEQVRACIEEVLPGDSFKYQRMCLKHIAVIRQYMLDNLETLHQYIELPIDPQHTEEDELLNGGLGNSRPADVKTPEQIMKEKNAYIENLGTTELCTAFIEVVDKIFSVEENKLSEFESIEIVSGHNRVLLQLQSRAKQLLEVLQTQNKQMQGSLAADTNKLKTLCERLERVLASDFEELRAIFLG